MKKLWQNRKKGFTLVELIVVIVIIAVLVAALTPAIMGVVNRANIAADRSDANAILVQAQAFHAVGGAGQSDIIMPGLRGGTLYPTDVTFGPTNIPTGFRVTTDGAGGWRSTGELIELGIGW
ncbi:MAG: prepilin-type N-terminal cleavage/methylation domain-containing protein [Defluviitaleaceae bacterium]|nr:prepilin-type N-terminal cleavage/methylation domain-containing protein [Defluviitaleaceae bacterium]MCL2239074.1 prepilin-type N-terminal cleavage/methylation domain-containing protein [Defluviitaleaceae bacterium]